MALRKRKRLATQAEKDRARRNGETVPTYVYVDSSSSYSSSDSGSSCSSSSSSYDSGSSSSSCDSGGGSF